jgi:hypothetical protein
VQYTGVLAVMSCWNIASRRDWEASILAFSRLLDASTFATNSSILVAISAMLFSVLCSSPTSSVSSRWYFFESTEYENIYQTNFKAQKISIKVP